MYMKIAVDAYGGDYAPLEVLKGSVMAVQELGVDVVLLGYEDEMRRVLKEHGLSDKGLHFVGTSEVIDIHEEPAAAVRTKKDSSMVVGLRMLREGSVDAFVSAGSTGALLAGATLIAKRIKGVKRAALAPVIPTDGGGAMLIDAGANTEVKPEYLYQFAVMGSIYMENILGRKNPKVGLLNNGSEDSKGTELQLQAYQLMKDSTQFNFYGNVEGRGGPLGEVDVLVADGFTGNIFLKTMEGMGKMFSKNLKEMLFKSTKNKMAALMLKKDIEAFAKKMDYKEEGGAILMGISKPVIKAHGSSDAKAFKNAIRQAKRIVEGHVVERITEEMAKASAQTEE